MPAKRDRAGDRSPASAAAQAVVQERLAKVDAEVARLEALEARLARDQEELVRRLRSIDPTAVIPPLD